MNDQKRPQWFERKLELCKKRQVEIVKITGKGHMFHHFKERQYETYHYLLHVAFLMKQREDFYIEEIVIPYQYKTENGAVISHEELKNKNIEQENSETLDLIEKRDGERERFTYDRMKAVQYAEQWWNSYHPDFRTFDVDCTNFVSQCIYAGGAPMWGSPNRERGWWYGGNNWSFSWAVAHSLRWYLSGATKGIKGVEVTTAEQLIPGDVICYDLEGMRFDIQQLLLRRMRMVCHLSMHIQIIADIVIGHMKIQLHGLQI